MDFKLRNRIFSYFGVNAKRNDSLKDSSGKGIGERYYESLGWGYDDLIQDIIDNDMDNIIVPATMKPALIPVMENMLGGIVNFTSDVAIRRKVIKFAHRLYNVKGTIKGYEILFRLLGFTTVVITLDNNDGTFDSTTFDDPFRTFDSDPGCGCGKYKIELTGPVIVSPAILEAVNSIITFNEPINGELTEVLYHGISTGIGIMGIESTFIVG